MNNMYNISNELLSVLLQTDVEKNAVLFEKTIYFKRNDECQNEISNVELEGLMVAYLKIYDEAFKTEKVVEHGIKMCHKVLVNDLTFFGTSHLTSLIAACEHFNYKKILKIFNNIYDGSVFSDFLMSSMVNEIENTIKMNELNTKDK